MSRLASFLAGGVVFDFSQGVPGGARHRRRLCLTSLGGFASSRPRMAQTLVCPCHRSPSSVVTNALVLVGHRKYSTPVPPLLLLLFSSSVVCFCSETRDIKPCGWDCRMTSCALPVIRIQAQSLMLFLARMKFYSAVSRVLMSTNFRTCSMFSLSPHCTLYDHQ
jgi:hypothetical protein